MGEKSAKLISLDGDKRCFVIFGTTGKYWYWTYYKNFVLYKRKKSIKNKKIERGNRYAKD